MIGNPTEGKKVESYTMRTIFPKFSTIHRGHCTIRVSGWIISKKKL